MRLSKVLAAASLSYGLTLAGCGSQSAPSEPTATEVATAVPSGTSTPSMTSPVATETPSVSAAGGDGIRGKGGLEEKCLARVASETGAKVIGTNRIEESEAAIEIYVNIEGAEAPWKCLGYKDGSIGDVMYTGSEGAA